MVSSSRSDAATADASDSVVDIAETGLTLATTQVAAVVWRNSLRFIVYEAVSREGAKTLRREVRKRKGLDLILECPFVVQRRLTLNELKNRLTIAESSMPFGEPTTS